MGRKVVANRGSSLIEVLMASFVITISLLAIAMTMVQGISSLVIGQEQLVAKQKAREALESVFTSRSTQNIVFDQIQNMEAGGIFLDSYQVVRGMGADGIANTADDAADPVETLTYAGKDGLLGTADDEIRSLSGFERKITISDVLLPNNDVDPDIRQITIEVRFVVNRVARTVRVNSLISRFS